MKRQALMIAFAFVSVGLFGIASPLRNLMHRVAALERHTCHLELRLFQSAHQDTLEFLAYPSFKWRPTVECSGNIPVLIGTGSLILEDADHDGGASIGDYVDFALEVRNEGGGTASEILIVPGPDRMEFIRDTVVASVGELRDPGPFDPYAFALHIAEFPPGVVVEFSGRLRVVREPGGDRPFPGKFFSVSYRLTFTSSLGDGSAVGLLTL